MKRLKQNTMENILMIVSLACLMLSVIALTGCVPAILGVKRYQSGTTTVDFITGADFSVGANGIDSVNNNRGIKPKYDFVDPKEVR